MMINEWLSEPTISPADKMRRSFNTRTHSPEAVARAQPFILRYRFGANVHDGGDKVIAHARARELTPPPTCTQFYVAEFPQRLGEHTTRDNTASNACVCGAAHTAV